MHLDRALELGGLDQPQHIGHIRHIHVAEPGADMGDPVVGVAEIIDHQPIRRRHPRHRPDLYT